MSFGFVVLAACQGGGGAGARERLDESSGITLRTDAEAIVFARTETRYSRSGRDYLYLGPVEANRQGTREYYLWVGVGTTLDRGYLAPPGESPDTLYLEVDGELMELKLRPWSEREPRLGAAPVYRTSVQLQSELAARVTLDQLTLLGGAALRSLRVADRDGNARIYFRWDDAQNWPSFLGPVADNRWPTPDSNRYTMDGGSSAAMRVPWTTN